MYSIDLNSDKKLVRSEIKNIINGLKIMDIAVDSMVKEKQTEEKKVENKKEESKKDLWLNRFHLFLNLFWVLR